MMATYGLPILFTLALWWVSTIAILYLDGLPRRTFPWSIAGFIPFGQRPAFG